MIHCKSGLFRTVKHPCQNVFKTDILLQGKHDKLSSKVVLCGQLCQKGQFFFNILAKWVV